MVNGSPTKPSFLHISRLALVLCSLTTWGLLLPGAQASAASPGAEAWGSNEVGQLGNGTTTKSEVPVAVSGLSGVTAIAGGGQNGLALLENGTVVAWGENDEGQLGDGTSTGPGVCPGFGGSFCSTAPVAVSGLSGVTAIATGWNQSLALLRNGTVMAWGNNEIGQLGDGSTGGYSDVPVEVQGLSGVTAIATGGEHSLALLGNGTVMAWGGNKEGQLGTGTTAYNNSDVPVEVQGLSGVTAIAGGGEDSLALLGNGTVVAWGGNGTGQLGDGTTADSDVPVAVSGLSGVMAIAAGAEHSLALLGDGGVMAWGAAGELGNGTETYSDVPVAVSGLSGVTAIAGGAEDSLALLGNGTVMAWGRPFLGDGSEQESDVPIAVSGLSGITAIATEDQDNLTIGPALVTVANIEPREGSVAGGTSVTITGTNFTGATAVKFGSNAATSFKVESETKITAVSPPGTNGTTVDVTVVTPGATSATSSLDRFTYGVNITKVEPSYGPPAGGTSVTITGTNFTRASAVKFGSTNAASFTIDSDTSITAVSPAGTGVVGVTVPTPEGTSPTSSADQFSYAPAVTDVTPAVGEGPGERTSVTITGTNFAGVSAVKFGSTNAASFTIDSDTSITAVSPPGQGTVDVIVTTAGGASPTSSADQFTYPKPAIYNESASNVTEHEATLAGQINPQGEWSLETTYVFEYGITTAYGASTPTPPGVISDGLCFKLCEITTPVPVSENLTGLEPGTTYHYRIVAKNTRGTNYGNDGTFTTQGSHAHPLGGDETPSTPGGGGQTSTSGTPTEPGAAPLVPGATPLVPPLVKTVKPKVLTKAQKLAKALKQCKQEPKRKRAACEKQAKKQYATTAKTRSTRYA